MTFFNTNFMQRTVSAIALAPLVLWIIYHGGLPFTILLVMVAVAMAFEWSKMVQLRIAKDERKISTLWQLLGLFYIVVPIISLLWLRQLEKGDEIVFWLIGVVWATDVAAYCAGRLIGGPKLVPKISPNKTWAGLLGGMMAAGAYGYVIGRVFASTNPVFLVAASAMLAIFAQAGDIFESWVKRHFGVKDSGSLIPGHGGILDRVDGLVAVAPKVVVFILLEGQGIF